jgi:hypothetical protein
MVLLPARFTARLPKLEFLGQYREAGILLAAGFLAGILLFLIWLALLPGRGPALTGAQSTAAGAAAQKQLGDADGVLSDITGGPQLGKRQPQVQPIEDGRYQEQSAADAETLDPEDGYADLPEGEVAPGDDGQDLAGGLLDRPAASPEDGQGGSLQTWYVEVMHQPGMSEYIEVNAESAEHARAIIRDYRGDPRIIRGPSIRPLD